MSSFSEATKITTEVFVGIGSNVDAAANLRHAAACLNDVFGQVELSSVYLSPAYGFVGADFLNMVAKFETQLSVDAVKSRLREIEDTAARIRIDNKFVPRTLDLDLLLFGETVDPDRRLPRHDILEYPFVLWPLLEIAPERNCPLTGTLLSAVWAALRPASVISRIGALDKLAAGSPADAASTVDG